MGKRKRPRRGFVACPACGAESRIGMRVCPECEAKLPKAGGGGAFWVVAIVVLGIAAIGVGAYLMREESKKPKKKRKPPADLVQPAEEKPVEKPKPKEAEAEEESILDLFGAGAGLPEPTMEAPGTEKVRGPEEGEGGLEE